MKKKLLELIDYNMISPGALGSLIRRIRELKGLSRGELGKKAGFGPSVSSEVRIRQYEVGINVPREEAVNRLADALEIDPHSLLNVDFSDAQNMYHALFFMENFQALHPVKINNHYYLEFGEKDMFDRAVNTAQNERFLADWYEMIQKSTPKQGELPQVSNQKRMDYAVWQYEYPLNIVDENTQFSLDRVNEQKNGALYEKKLNEALEIRGQIKNIELRTENDITLSHLVRIIQALMSLNVQTECDFSSHSDKKSPGTAIVAFKIDDILSSEKAILKYVDFLVTVKSICQNNPKEITRQVISKNNVLYVAFFCSGNNPQKYAFISDNWEDMEFLATNPPPENDIEAVREYSTRDCDFIAKLVNYENNLQE